LAGKRSPCKIWKGNPVGVSANNKKEIYTNGNRSLTHRGTQGRTIRKRKKGFLAYRKKKQFYVKDLGDGEGRMIMIFHRKETWKKKEGQEREASPEKMGKKIVKRKSPEAVVSMIRTFSTIQKHRGSKEKKTYRSFEGRGERRGGTKSCWHSGIRVIKGVLKEGRVNSHFNTLSHWEEEKQVKPREKRGTPLRQ